MPYGNADMGEMVGQKIVAITGCEHGSDRMVVTTDRGRWEFFHEQDCCESVDIVQVDGDPADLVGATVVIAEESCPDLPVDEDEYCDDSHTWTFYRIVTNKQDLTVRWLGQSNGYYSESVTVTFTEE